MSSRELLLEVRSDSPAATEELGKWLGARLAAGQGISLRGDLGAGKTVFVRGLARGLEVDLPEEVRSPTYLLMVEHGGRIPLLHLDAYFAERGADFLRDGGEAYVNETGVVAVEWADRLGLALPPDFLDVEIRHAGEEARILRFHGDRRRWGVIVTGLAADLHRSADRSRNSG
jgi:tRNA threonylcarbamoyladenosine biosynthesis protein TsaE